MSYIDPDNTLLAFGLNLLLPGVILYRVMILRTIIRHDPRSWSDHIWPTFAFHLGLQVAFFVVAVVYSLQIYKTKSFPLDHLTFIVCLGLAWLINYRFLQQLLSKSKRQNV